MLRQLLKRLHGQSRSDAEPPTKGTKTQSEIEHEAWESWEYPPEFWDRLSEISLTQRAIAEHNRRVRLQQHPCPSLPGPKERAEHLQHTFPKRSLAQFARLGGPDLSDLRGCPHQSGDSPPCTAMGASQSSCGQTPKSVAPVTTTTTKTKKSSPYNRNFDLHLTDHNVHPTYSSQRPNLSKVRDALTVARLSTSSSKSSESAFESFQESNWRAKDEDEVLANVIPTILGSHQPDHASARNTVFGNLEPLTDGTIVAAKPDIYYGAHPEELSRLVRDELGHHLMPSTMQDKPLAPNFFVEVKGPSGHAAVAMLQARYNGALGSRAMHSLQNYGKDKPQYDGQVYTYSFTYLHGYLRLYAHHLTAPTSDGGRPEYHMTQVGAWGMDGDIDSFRRGVAAFRNARDMAKRHRDEFIQAANARALQARAFVSQDVAGTLEEPDPVADPSARRDANKTLQQHIASEYDAGEAVAIPLDVYSDGESDDQSQDSMALGDDPSSGFASSFTLCLSSTKRPRQTSSHLGGDRPSKRQKRPVKRRTAESTNAVAAQSGASESREGTRQEHPYGLDCLIS